MKRAALLDRDGVLNVQAAEHDYVKSWEELRWLPGAREAISLLTNSGWLVIVVTNQRGISRGMISMRDVEDIHRGMQRDLSKMGTKIDAFYVCPHNLSDQCNCRKPKPGLLLQAAKDFGLCLTDCWFVGDSQSDIEVGKETGCRTVFVGSREEAVTLSVSPDAVFNDLLSAVKNLLVEHQHD